MVVPWNRIPDHQYVKTDSSVQTLAQWTCAVFIQVQHAMYI